MSFGLYQSLEWLLHHYIANSVFVEISASSGILPFMLNTTLNLTIIFHRYDAHYSGHLISDASWFWMVKKRSVVKWYGFQIESESPTLRNLDKRMPFCQKPFKIWTKYLDFKWPHFQMVGTIALKPDPSKTGPFEIWFRRVGFEIPIVVVEGMWCRIKKTLNLFEGQLTSAVFETWQEAFPITLFTNYWY